MKPSHLQTPRTLSDCTFTSGYMSVQPRRPFDYPDRIVMWGCLIAAVATVAIVLLFPEAA